VESRHDIVIGKKTVREARDYYAKEFLDYRRKLPTRGMNELNFPPQSDCGDPDQRLLSEADLEEVKQEALKSTDGPSRRLNSNSVLTVKSQTQLFVIRHWESYEYSGSDRFEGVADWARSGSSRSA
jgi:hypothetical protein